VPIDRVLAEGCKLSHKLPNLASLHERRAKNAQDLREQTAKEEKAAAKAVKKTGRARGAKGVPAAGDAAVPDGAAAPDGAAVAGGAAVVGAAVGAAGVALAGSDVPEQTGTDGRGAAPAEATGEVAGHPQAAATVTPAVARRRPPILVVLLLLFIAASSGAGAWLFQQQAVTATKQRPSSNIALLDKAATAEVVAQISKAIEAIYTYDSATLDASESQALSQITGSYVDDFRDTIASVRALPAQQRASLSSKVVAAGVITMTERRASLLVMLDQVGRRGENAQTGKSAVRLRVTAQRVDGQWKVSDIDQK
jgi:Mce-associated membrane protein